VLWQFKNQCSEVQQARAAEGGRETADPSLVLAAQGRLRTARDDKMSEALARLNRVLKNPDFGCQPLKGPSILNAYGIAKAMPRYEPQFFSKL